MSVQRNEMSSSARRSSEFEDERRLVAINSNERRDRLLPRWSNSRSIGARTHSLDNSDKIAASKLCRKHGVDCNGIERKQRKATPTTR